MIVNDAEVLAQVTAAVDAYETALMTNDVEALDGFFRDAPETVRYGVAENLYGFSEIAAFRIGRTGGSPLRERLRTEITTFGRDFAIANVEFLRTGAKQPGRQSQTWLRTESGWKIVSAHVSLLQGGADQRLAP
ncbi:oxalurate catabolism protein HpxZ [Caulobacter endophyticus]|uniref:Oxalurate catabolism protein HpxZ n=1 Tax=Caulobacter endophyticus TaxID=2172652 RepID=A0A2T9KD27_9CAUL|nr:oxalurate catabolism protein HpxZ [Caulobacter endophyticus]PVM93874.1 oxalurate catabolism protein HpxZ [Caulobacter endophyticus]